MARGVRACRCRVGFVLLLCWTLGCAQKPASPTKAEEKEDYSFEAVAAEYANQSKDEQTRLRAAYKAEVEDCEKDLGGEWERPGLCCVWSAMGCTELPLKAARRGHKNG